MWTIHGYSNFEIVIFFSNISWIFIKNWWSCHIYFLIILFSQALFLRFFSSKLMLEYIRQFSVFKKNILQRVLRNNISFEVCCLVGDMPLNYGWYASKLQGKFVKAICLFPDRINMMIVIFFRTLKKLLFF